MPEVVSDFGGRAGLQQRVLPEYRVPFFDLLAEHCAGGLGVFAGQPRAGEAIVSGRRPTSARWFELENSQWLGGPLFLLRQPNLLDRLHDWEPQVLILEANIRYLDNWRALAWARKRGIPVIGWGLGVPALRRRRPLLGWLWKNFLARFNALIAYSTVGAAEYRQTGQPADRVFVALNAVASHAVEPTETSAPTNRPVRLLFVGRLQPRKGVDRLLRACGMLETGRVELRIVGDGPDRVRLEAVAARHFPEAEFVGDQRHRGLAESYAWADLFVLPGTGGLAIQQAMAHGLPVIVGQGDGTQADLVRPDNGWLVEDDTVDSLQTALEKGLANPEELVDMGRASAEMVREEINLNAMVQTFISAMLAVTRGSS